MTTSGLFAPFIRARYLAVIFIPAIPAFFFGYAVWFLGMYLRVFPMWREAPLNRSLLAAILPLTYAGFVTARLRSIERERHVDAALWLRRVGQLALFALIAMVAVAAYVGFQFTTGAWSAESNAFSTWIAIGVLIVAVLLSLVRDRDPELTCLLTACAFLATIPIVVFGRALYALVVDSLYRIVSWAGA